MQQRTSDKLQTLHCVTAAMQPVQAVMPNEREVVWVMALQTADQWEGAMSTTKRESCEANVALVVVWLSAARK